MMSSIDPKYRTCCFRPNDDSNGVFQDLINTHNGVKKWQNLN